MKQTFEPLTEEQYLSIKEGDIVERMLAFCIPNKLIVSKVTDKTLECGPWIFDRHTGLEIDDAIPSTVSYIRSFESKIN